MSESLQYTSLLHLGEEEKEGRSGERGGGGQEWERRRMREGVGKEEDEGRGGGGRKDWRRKEGSGEEEEEGRSGGG